MFAPSPVKAGLRSGNAGERFSLPARSWSFPGQSLHGVGASRVCECPAQGPVPAPELPSAVLSVGSRALTSRDDSPAIPGRGNALTALQRRSRSGARSSCSSSSLCRARQPDLHGPSQPKCALSAASCLRPGQKSKGLYCYYSNLNYRAEQTPGCVS